MQSFHKKTRGTRSGPKLTPSSASKCILWSRNSPFWKKLILAWRKSTRICCRDTELKRIALRQSHFTKSHIFSAPFKPLFSTWVPYKYILHCKTNTSMCWSILTSIPLPFLVGLHLHMVFFQWDYCLQPSHCKWNIFYQYATSLPWVHMWCAPYWLQHHTFAREDIKWLSWIVMSDGNGTCWSCGWFCSPW